MRPFLESDRYEYDLSPGSMVWDCGGFKGDFAATIADKYKCRVIVFEPIPEFATIIRNRFSNNTQVTVLNAGVGGGSRHLNFFVRGDSSGAYRESGRIVPVEIAGLCDLFEQLPAAINPDVIDLAKINIEGQEFEFLECAIENDLIYRFQNIQVQWHDSAPNAAVRYDILQLALNKTHELQWDHGWVWQSWRIR